MATNDVTRVAIVLKALYDQVQSGGTIDLTPYVKRTELSAYSTTDEVNVGIATGVTDAKQYTDTTATTIKSEYEKAINDAISALAGTSPELLDTLEEIANALQNNPDIITEILASLATKASSEDLATHLADTVLHVSATERTSWNGRVTQEQLTAATEISDPTLAAWVISEAGE